MLVCLGCGTVNPGQDITFSPIVYDSGFFYCSVEPMLFAQRCGPGQSSDPPSGCHANVTMFRLQDHAQVSCKGNVADPTSVPSEAQSNYTAASREMDRDPMKAALLNRPTQNAAHPRKIFAIDSPQADVIRKWATQYTSQ